MSPLPSRVIHRGQSTVVGSGNETFVSELLQIRNRSFQLRSRTRLIGVELAYRQDEIRVARYPTSHGVLVTLAVCTLDAWIARGVNYHALVRTRSKWNHGASVFINRILAGQRLAPRCWRLLCRFDGLRPSPEVTSTT